MMKAFDYRCGFCGHKFEAITEHDDDRPQCEACQSDNTSRLFPGPAVKKFAGLDRAIDKQQTKKEKRQAQVDRAMNPRQRPKGFWQRGGR